MKIKFLAIGIGLILCSCNAKREHQKREIAANYNIYGDTISVEKIISAEKTQAEYQSLKVGDTSVITFKAKVTDVCKAKGCWMKLDLENGEEAMVKFKDYSFFVPKDITGKEVVLSGKAYVDMMSVEDQKHYAEDGGATESEIEKITTPSKTYSFEANGVLLKK